jgi:hypothetical protein
MLLRGFFDRRRSKPPARSGLGRGLKALSDMSPTQGLVRMEETELSFFYIGRELSGKKKRMSEVGPSSTRCLRAMCRDINWRCRCRAAYKAPPGPDGLLRPTAQYRYSCEPKGFQQAEELRSAHSCGREAVGGWFSGSESRWCADLIYPVWWWRFKMAGRQTRWLPY